MYLEDSLNEIGDKKINFSHDMPIMVVNIVIFTIYKNKLCVVMLSDTNSQKTDLILPGGLVMKGLSLGKSLENILYHKIGIKLSFKEQLYTFGNPDKSNPDVHIICTSYFTLINKRILLKDVDLTKIVIIEYDKIDSLTLGYDHKNIIKFAKNKLDFRLEYTTIGKYMLSPKFTIPQMQNDYEIMFGEQFDKRNFRKKVQLFNIVKFTGEYDKTSSNRPAKLYEFVSKDIEYIDGDIVNLNLYGAVD